MSSVPYLDLVFIRIKCLGALVVNAGWDASPWQGYVSILLGFPNSLLVAIYTPGSRETMWSKVSSLRKQGSAYSDQASSH